MSSNALKSHAKTKVLALSIGALVLTGCDENGEFQLPSFGGEDSAGASTFAAPSVSLVERDVEAPEVFSVDENGLWDGRPSLGGVWVAHPDAVDPERVIIRNNANGSSVIGALFRRERENAGPALQVSSDAAEELGVLAGAPTQLSVVALRREEAPVEELPTLETAALDAPVAVTATPLDEPTAEVADTPAASSGTAASTLSDIFASAPASGAPSATTTEGLTGAAAIAIAAAEAAAAAETPTPQPASAPSSSLEKPYIQIGIFSVEDNAQRTNELLSSNGLVGTVLAQSSNGRPFWRVIVGPSPTTTDRAEVLNKVKSLGFTDAYFVTN